jgi:CheY-like chemotaxis protein
VAYIRRQLPREHEFARDKCESLITAKESILISSLTSLIVSGRRTQKKSRAQGGLGLGLAIVRELISAHNGSVVAESAGKGQGSTFTVTLPIPAVILEHINGRTSRPVDDQPSIAGLRVLIVDDDADARETIAITLESLGAMIEISSSSEEAWKSIRRSRPDLLVADIGMPEEDGYTLIQKVRRYEREMSEKHLRQLHSPHMQVLRITTTL